MVRTVLILEDEAFISAHIEDVLTDYAMIPVGPFRSNAAALDYLARAAPDAAVVDLNVLDGTCQSTVERLCELGVPFLMLSGSPKASAAGLAMEDAIWLEKPFSEQMLIGMLIGLIHKMHLESTGSGAPSRRIFSPS